MVIGAQSDYDNLSNCNKVEHVKIWKHMDIIKQYKNEFSPSLFKVNSWTIVQIRPINLELAVQFSK